MWKFRRKKTIKPNETILDSEKFMYEEEEKPESDKRQIDYNLLPHSEAGIVGLVCSIVSLLFMFACIYLILKQGNAPELNATAAAACAILWSIAGIFFAREGVKKKNRNYVLCYVSFTLSGIQLMTWIITIILTNKQ